MGKYLKSKKIIILILLYLVSALLLLLAWQVPGFSDGYVRYVYPAFLETYGRITGLFPFSIGEIMLYLAVIYTAFTVFVVILRLVMWMLRRDLFKRLNTSNLKVFVYFLGIVVFIQTANCFIMYHTTPLYKSDGFESDYVSSTEDLFSLREKLVIRANALALTFDRDEKGDVIYEGDMKLAATEANRKLGQMAKEKLENGRESILFKPLSRLTGYYSLPKALWKSDFFSQQHMEGYFFPFSLEANYNDLMNIANFPNTFCHELSHLKGFILEDEASFISYLACIYSGDEFFEYSGILNALAYVNNECNRELEADPALWDTLTITSRSELVRHDMTFVSEEVWQEIEADAIISTEVAHKASETFLETNLTVNGISDGVVSYSRQVDLMLEYYFGSGAAFE